MRYALVRSLIAVCVLFTASAASAVTIGYDSPKKQGFFPREKQGYFVIVEKVSGRWEIKDISDSPKKRSNENQEVLLVGRQLDDVQPFFEEDGDWSWIDDLTFKCKVGAGRNKEKYTPCNSNLTAVRRTDFFFLAGNTTYVLSKDKVIRLLKETDLISKIVALNKTRLEDEKKAFGGKTKFEVIKTFPEKIKVEPQIIDESGFSPGADATADRSIEYRIFYLNEIELETVMYVVTLAADTDDFDIEIKPRRYELRYNADGYLLKPVMKLHTKKFRQVYPPYLNEDVALKIDFDGKGVTFHNKTDQYIQIKSISVYYNYEVSSFDMKKVQLDLDVPPQSSSRTPIMIDPLITDNVRKQADYEVSRDVAMIRNINFGFAVKYTLANQALDRTLFKTNNYNLNDVLKTEKIPESALYYKLKITVDRRAAQ